MTPTQLHGFLKAQGRGTILRSSPHPSPGRWGLGTGVGVGELGGWGVKFTKCLFGNRAQGINKWGQAMGSTKALGTERRWMGKVEVRECGVWERKAEGKRQTTVDKGM